MKRIDDKMLDNLIKNEGTTDGINVPSVTGILRLALDLKDARQDLAACAKEIKKYQDDYVAQAKKIKKLESKLKKK